ncbi:MAG: ABC transporter ATP-binding protein [Rhodospirillaceae bacterium]|nr:ABC transporter ATP-binding protein [Rhodospirillaceae bacterium]
MAELELRKVDRWHHRRIILDELSLKAPSGRITALLGDEESGRLTAIKVIAGIEKPQGGSILIDGEEVLGQREGIREAATVFRTAALMPHKTALENIAYPLRIARFDRETIEARVLAVGEHFGITDILAQRPKKLTDIQCYQIGLARALVRDPGVYLFELPTEEDPELRNLAISEMKRLRDEFGRTVVYAAETVDDVDDLADWVVVLDEGRRLQMGSPGRIVKWPASRRVAKLFGARLRAARVMGTEHDAITVRLKDGDILTIPWESDEAAAGERATLAIWPEDIDREGETAVYPPEHCYLFNERGHLVAGPSGPPPKRKTKGASKRR